MISEQKEKDKIGFQLLAILDEYNEYEHTRTACLPACLPVLPHGGNEYGETASQPASQPAHSVKGFTVEDLKELDSLERAIEAVYEGEQAVVNPMTLPRLVTRGHHSLKTIPPSIEKQTTKHDWLSFTAQEPYWIMQELLELACPDIKFIKRKNGINGYHSGFNVTKDNRQIATLLYGSLSNEKQNQKPQVIITGGGSTDYFDFSIIYHYALLMEKATITVIHVAYDDFEGVNTIESVTQAHKDKKFMSLKSSKNPLIRPIGTIQPDGSNPGRSVYIGSTQSSIGLCAYEKGHESYKVILNSEDPKNESSKLFMQDVLKSGQKSKWRNLSKSNLNNDLDIDNLNKDLYENDGNEFDLAKWLRLELRVRNSNREIPLDILIYPDKYFSGAYPFTEELMKMSDSKKTVLFKTVDELELLVRIQNMKAIAGSLIEDLLCLGWSDSDVVEALKSGKGASQKLIRSGAYKDC